MPEKLPSVIVQNLKYKVISPCGHRYPHVMIGYTHTERSKYLCALVHRSLRPQYIEHLMNHNFSQIVSNPSTTKDRETRQPLLQYLI
ncbi:hypothetical protein ACTXT7_002429 [Hymenolepis weldensis]